MVSEHMRRCPARSGDRAPTPGRRLRAPTVHAAVENLTPPSAGEDGSSRNLRSPAGWQNGTQRGSGGGRMERRGALVDGLELPIRLDAHFPWPAASFLGVHCGEGKAPAGGAVSGGFVHSHPEQKQAEGPLAGEGISKPERIPTTKYDLAVKKEGTRTPARAEASPGRDAVGKERVPA